MPPMESPASYLGPRIKFLSLAFARKFFEIARTEGIDEVTIMHGQILGYLYHCPHKDIYQKDLEETFHISRSSVTGIVKLMEQKGYILRQSVPGDARLKKLSLTEPGTQACKEAMAAFRQVEALATQNLDQEQLATFFALCDIIQNNLKTNQEGAHAKNHSLTNQGV